MRARQKVRKAPGNRIVARGREKDQARATALRNLASVLAYEGDCQRALGLLEQALALFQAVGDRLGEANGYAARAALDVVQHEAKANQELEQAIVLYKEIGDKYSPAAMTGNLGWALRRALHLLADFAFYCGTGYKTTQGMGQTRKIERVRDDSQRP